MTTEVGSANVAKTLTEQVEKMAETAKKKRRKYKRRRARPTAATEPRPFKAPEEFAGMTAKSCCEGCARDPIVMEAAQTRVNEIDRMYPRRESQNPKSETVMESDAEWLARNPQIADEWRKQCRTAMGMCVISGGSWCAHPFKGIRPRTADGYERWARAKEALMHEKIKVNNA